MQQINIDQIRIDGDTQPRIRIDQALVDEYAEAMTRGDDFPPVELVSNGADMWLVDGFHRLAATKRAGASTIAANVREGELRDAQWIALAANGTHGAKRTRADLRNAVMRALLDADWRKKSNRELARHLHCDHKTVAARRRELEETGTIARESERQVTRQGVTYTQDVTGLAERGQEEVASGEIPQMHEEPDAPEPEHTPASTSKAKQAADRRRAAMIEAGIIPSDPPPEDVEEEVVEFDKDSWSTPERIIQAARRIFGGTIDLDPATNAEAQAIVRATEHYTAQTNGLGREWHGNVWLNPPYSQPLCKEFTRHLIAEYRAGRVTGAVLLVNTSTGARWWHECAAACTRLAFPKGRIQFWHPSGASTRNNRFDQTIFYFGDEPELFEQHALAGWLVLEGLGQIEEGAA